MGIRRRKRGTSRHTKSDWEILCSADSSVFCMVTFGENLDAVSMKKFGYQSEVTQNGMIVRDAEKVKSFEPTVCMQRKQSEVDALFADEDG